jgi:hypothetical protein
MGQKAITGEGALGLIRLGVVYNALWHKYCWTCSNNDNERLGKIINCRETSEVLQCFYLLRRSSNCINH